MATDEIKEAEKYPAVRNIVSGLTAYYELLSADFIITTTNGSTNKFSLWCHENGFDDDDIKTEIDDNNPQDCSIVDFDDNFPFNQTISDKSQKNLAIFKILKHCYKTSKPPATNKNDDDDDEGSNVNHDNNDTEGAQANNEQMDVDEEGDEEEAEEVTLSFMDGTEILERTEPKKGDDIEYDSDPTNLKKLKIEQTESHIHKGKIIAINEFASKIIIKSNDGYCSYSLNEVSIKLPPKTSKNTKKREPKRPKEEENNRNQATDEKVNDSNGRQNMYNNMKSKINERNSNRKKQKKVQGYGEYMDDDDDDDSSSSGGGYSMFSSWSSRSASMNTLESQCKNIKKFGKIGALFENIDENDTELSNLDIVKKWKRNGNKSTKKILQDRNRDDFNFEYSKQKKNWSTFVHGHYDWYMFPWKARNTDSFIGRKYSVLPGDVIDLIFTENFIDRYLNSINCLIQCKIQSKGKADPINGWVHPARKSKVIASLIYFTNVSEYINDTVNHKKIFETKQKFLKIFGNQKENYLRGHYWQNNQ